MSALHRDRARDTRLVHYDPAPGDPFRPSATPLHQTATFAQDDPESFSEYDYSRSGNPTRTVLEERVADLEGASTALAFASGMAAIASVLRLLRPGDRIVVGDDLYGGTYRLLGELVGPSGVDVVRVDTRDIDAVEKAVAGGPTRLVLFETPSNPLHHVTDIAAVSAIAHRYGAHSVVDSTMMSPYLQRPLDHGADLVIQSATKYLSGHADVTAGTVAARDDERANRIAFIRNAEGTALAPFEAWLLLRGLKTLGIRIDRQQQNAARVAAHLEANDRVREVYFVGSAKHPDRATHERQASGAGAVLSFRASSPDAARAFVAATELFSTTVSFGSLHSTVSLPSSMSHASIPEAERRARPLPEGLVRLSVGIEDPEDLLRDLEQALHRSGAERVTAP